MGKEEGCTYKGTQLGHRKNEKLPLRQWVGLEGIMSHEVGPTEKDKYSIISHVGSENQRKQDDAETDLPIREGLNLK